MRTNYKPVLYLLDDNDEATDVLHFCSIACRYVHKTELPTAPGTSADWIDGTVCDECGDELTARTLVDVKVTK